MEINLDLLKKVCDRYGATLIENKPGGFVFDEEIKFIEYGETLGTRACARKILSEFESSILKNDKTILNFNQVTLLSYGFVDELIGTLIRKYGLDFFKEKINFIGVNNFNKKVILKVIERVVEIEINKEVVK